MTLDLLSKPKTQTAASTKKEKWRIDIRLGDVGQVSPGELAPKVHQARWERQRATGQKVSVFGWCDRSFHGWGVEGEPE